jgi:diaminohydroxyphosphoribosylaminopyrimidine deaminase / 5-amino-6-(5-phosphoribosylamino)uracil reductase
LRGGNSLIVTATGSDARTVDLIARGVDVMRVPTETVKGKTDLPAMMESLANYRGGINHIMVETGAKLNASLLSANVVDEIIFYIAPSIFGDSARGLFAIPELTDLQDKIELKFSDVRMVGPDLRITTNVNHSAGET